MIKSKSQLFLLCFFSIIGSACLGQDSLYTREIIKTLCSEKYHGRGYVKSGDKKTAVFIEKEFKRNGLKPFPFSGYRQYFSFSVNTFPSKMEVKIDGKLLAAGIDYIVHPGSPTIKGTFKVLRVNKSISAYTDDELKDQWILLDTNQTDNLLSNEDFKDWLHPNKKINGIVKVEPKKLTWSVSTSVQEFGMITLLKSSIVDYPESIALNIQTKFIEKHSTSNVLGYIEGKIRKDSLILVSAHYDHLGRMGEEVIFPGANDNASGIAMLMQLGKHFSLTENQPEYSMLFVAFAGEEAGLIGSKFYTENPLFPLSKIKFLLNLDLLGTGDEGMMVVNATEFPSEFQKLDSINNVHQYLPKISKRGKAANSDHYWFSEAGVPSFFCYTLGGISAYHDVYDIAETLPLTKFNELQKLFIAFLSSR